MSLQVLADFRVIDESPDWIVVDKAAPLIVHPANRKPEPTLLGGVEYLLAFEMENGATPAVVNRLDRDTSGLVLVAKHRLAARQLGMCFDRREVRKEYIAIVTGWPAHDHWSCKEPILPARNLGPSDIWIRQCTHPSGRPCETEFFVENRFERNDRKFARIRCVPKTGRMHQIRVHLATSGFPLLGDKLYTGDGSCYLEWMKTGWTDSLAAKLLLPRHALHAARMVIEIDDQIYDWQTDIAQDMADFEAGNPLLARQGVVIWSRHD
ncbi:MAG: RluA family pseudouridine synthase [Luteolibacter sp.]